MTEARLGEHQDRLRLVLEADRAVSPNVSVMGDARQIALRFDDPVVWRAPMQIKARPGLEAYVTLANRSGGDTRDLTLTLSLPVRILGAFTLPADRHHPIRIVVDMALGSTANDPQATATLNKTGTGSLGTLIVRPGPKPAVLGEGRKDTPLHASALPARDTPSPRRRPVIVIDAGHGGKDTGAIGVTGVREKDVTLRAARIVAKTLKESGRYDVVLTRDSDVFIRLGDRVAIARRHKADVFISLHADSLPAGRPDVRGASIYTISDKASDEQTAKLAARENKADLIGGMDLQHEDKDIADILVDLAMRDTQNQARTFANTVVASFDGKDVRLLERPHRYAGFAVLKAPDIPSVLVEMGFMSSPKDEKLLRTDDFLNQIARALHRAIDDYFAALDVSMMQ